MLQRTNQLSDPSSRSKAFRHEPASNWNHVTKKHNIEIDDEIIVPNDIIKEEKNDIDIIEDKKPENVKSNAIPKITDYFQKNNKMDLKY